MTADVQPWRPDFAEARLAMVHRGLVSPEPEYVTMHEQDVRAVLEASGASAEIERLRAVLAAAQHVIETLRAENIDLVSLALALTLEPVLADMAAGSADKAIAAVAAFGSPELASPGHTDGWENAGGVA